MNVLIFQPYLTPYRVGLFNELNAQSEVDLTVCYFSKYEKRRKWKINEERQFTEKRMQTIVIPVSFETNKIFFNFFHLRLLLRKLKPDVVVTSQNKIGLFLARFKDKFGYKIVNWTEVHSLAKSNSKFSPKRIQLFWKHTDAHIVPGKLSYEYIISTSKADTTSVFICPNSVSSNQFSTNIGSINEKFASSALEFVFCGSLTKRKGFHLLLEAISKLNHSSNKASFHFSIIGQGPLSPEPFRNATYYGFCSTEKCAEIMRRAHIFVLPSLRDCNPLTVLEASKSGNVLLLSSAVGNHPEFIPECGLLFDKDSSEALYLAILEVLNLQMSKLEKYALQSYAKGNTITDQKSARVMLSALSHALKDHA